MAALEDVLGGYARRYDPACPVVVRDEKPLPLLAAASAGTPAAPGRVAREDSAYVRCGTCSSLVWAEPLRGYRRAYAEFTRTRVDGADGVEQLLNVDYPAADQVVLVTDNLRHPLHRLPLRGIPTREGPRPGSPVADPPPPQARLLAQHHRDRTVLPDHATPRPAHRRPRRPGEELTAWTRATNADERPVDGRFTTRDARIKLRHLYPAL